MRQELLRKGITTILPSMVGARLGPLAPVFTKAPPIVGRAVGAAGGAAAGEATGQVFGPPGGDPAEDARAILQEAAYGAAGEFGGALLENLAVRSAARGAQLYDRYLAPHLGRGASEAGLARAAALVRDREAMEVARVAQEHLTGAPGERGLTLTAEQIADYMRPSHFRSILQRVTGMLRKTGPLKIARERSGERMDLEIQEFVRGLGAKNPSAAASLASLAVENSKEAHRLATRAAWLGLESELASMGSAVSVNVRPLWASGRQELGRAGISFRPGVRRMARLIQQEGTDVTRPVFDWSGQQTGTLTTRYPKLSFEEAQDLRAALREAAEGTQPLVGVSQGFAKKLLRRLDKQIDAAEAELQAYGRQDIVDAYALAKGLSREGATRFNNNIVRGWLQNIEPEKIYASIANANSPTRTRMMRRFYEEAIGRGAIPDTAWEDVGAQFIKDALEKGVIVDSPRGAVSAVPMAGMIRKYRNSGVLDELFPGPKGARMIDNFERLVKIKMVTEQAGKGSEVAFDLMQVRGLYILATTAAGGYGGYKYNSSFEGAKWGGGAGLAFGVIFGPRTLARLLADRQFADLLIRGYAQGASSRLSSRLLGHMLVRASQIKMEEGLSDAELSVNEEMLRRVNPKTYEIEPTREDIYRDLKGQSAPWEVRLPAQETPPLRGGRSPLGNR
jgi:hypothetical protein